ncbi:DUF4974 domain-containing protein [Chitinophaga pendula]|uniref:FecR family protein n=1 Tax=Chitinophaga TaxID=79328 RepID=UPI000BB0AA4E|nr:MULTISPECIES: FecR family protein [Chitinophaga]ASZ13411.1 hypothetical protein CK934_21825 [Chitinophaga sp. MD30]UCJ08965.1 DUF4974 domain-containing protein [Chitinophaga pendula]
MQQKEIDPQLLQKYLEGTCSPEEWQQVYNYLYDQAYADSLAANMQQDWHHMMAQQLPAPAPEKYDTFLRKTGQTASPVLTLSPWRKTLRWTAAAAVALLVITGGWYWQRHRQEQQAFMALQWHSLHNEQGHSSVIILPDSSRVFLGAGSTLRYQHNFNDANRDLYLEGEAYFVVKHGGTQPFRVTTGKITTTDVGTEFNIRYVPNISTIDISVAKGEVAVSHGNNTTALLQSERLRYEMATGKAIKEKITTNEAVGGWRNGQLSFQHQRLQTVMQELERHYGTTIHLDTTTTGNITITSTIVEASLEDALDIICTAAGVHYTKQGNIITIR